MKLSEAQWRLLDIVQFDAAAGREVRVGWRINKATVGALRRLGLLAEGGPDDALHLTEAGRVAWAEHETATQDPQRHERGRAVEREG